MAENNTNQTQSDSDDQVRLQSGTYEVIRNRLDTHGKELRTRLESLNAARKEVFGAIESKLLASERVATNNNCVPRDMISVGDYFIFGYNVFIGLRTETTLKDVFAVYKYHEGQFVECTLNLIDDERFILDFKNLYKYYRHTVFAKFALIGPHLFMVFRTGQNVGDIKTFKWLVRQERLEYLDSRSDHEYVYPPQHSFEWTRTTQDMHRSGINPHISIEDRIFVETVGGDLTVKVEDNTETGEGIYSEPVDDPDQTLNDAEIHYAILGSTILLKMRPYQEQNARYIIYSEKTRCAVRVDSIKDACILLPGDQGLVFPKGYYLQTGEIKQFDIDMADMVYEKCYPSPNGEDFLYVFYNRHTGVYVLLSYNLIAQEISTPLVCNGFSLFEDGTLIYFRADDQPQKHHVIQIWTTPFYGPDYTIDIMTDSQLYKIGNTSIVRCMAECTELLNLIAKDVSYANLYHDISKKAQDIRDAYFWLAGEETFDLAEPLAHINEAASAAIDEYEKVVRTRRNTTDQINAVSANVRQIITSLDYESLDEIDEYVHHLAQLRSIRGEVVSLRDLRYADPDLIEALETQVAEHTEKLSAQCVEFLLHPESLTPYEQRIHELSARVDEVQKVAEAKELTELVAETASQLEMLTEIVSNLKIADATETVAIIDNISLVYSQVNQVKAALKNRTNDLGVVEGRAEFASQIKLIDQSVINFLDICDTPEKCEEYLTKVSVQLETLESRFADFDEFVLQLTEKREELYNAFESRKIQLVARRNQRAAAVMTAAERVLKGIENRVKNFTDVNEINGYFASDLMVERVRDNIDRLMDLGDSVKAEDVKSRLKTLQQDAIRRLKDRQALYEDGDDIIRLGRHRFSVNRQDLEGTIVRREDDMFYHLTGTGFFESITDAEFLATRDAWDLELASESPDVYRAEYLAYKMLQDLLAGDPAEIEQLLQADLDEVVKRTQAFMGPRYEEGYVKGVHDHDAAKILRALLQLKSEIGLLRYPSRSRALAVAFWILSADREGKDRIAARIAGAGHIRKLFADACCIENEYVNEARQLLRQFVDETDLFDPCCVDPAAEYLFHELAGDGSFVLSHIAANIKTDFQSHLRSRRFATRFAESAKAVAEDPVGLYHLMRDWVLSFLSGKKDSSQNEYADEVASLLIDDDADNRLVIDHDIERTLTEMIGSHPRIAHGEYTLNYCDFMTRLINHEQRIAPRFRQYQHIKKQLIEEYADQLRLDEFKPRVLTTFVRNKLIDKVYLPLIGDNLARQIGTADDTKRTDRQGLLLLISPPGYGKTTLMEYVANRLGLTFVKINGPAVGNAVTSFDPAEAPNAAAREEVAKLNLAFEMGDNVMIYVDDIQHTNPEFLQKFISLCDAQRRVEGVFKNRSRTYDLRGKRVCVVMAGNPYTESGEKFKIPDMLSNRADTYNIGDIVGDNYDQFVASYVENCLTSNPVLQKLANHSQHDVYQVMKIADTGQQDGVEFEGNYSVDELNEYVATMKKLFTVRLIVLKVNRQYIASAGQADEYRTEPPFLLQGSYRNMNRIASRVLPVMNDDELWTLIFSAYQQDAQTLTTGAESNLLKFRELTDTLNDQQAKRWADIKKTFGRNLILGGHTDDKIGAVISQLSGFTTGLDSIKDVLADGITAISAPRKHEAEKPKEDHLDEFRLLGRDVLSRMNDMIETIKQQQDIQQQHENTLDARLQDKNAKMLVSVLEEQFKTMETWLIPVHHSDADRKVYFEHLVERFQAMVDGYTRLIDALKHKYNPPKPGADRTAPAKPPTPPKSPAKKKRTSKKSHKTEN